MAKTSVTFAVIFSVFFVISHARTSFNLPANEWTSISTTTTPSSSSSESDTTKSSESDTTTTKSSEEEDLHTIQLPSEKSKSDDHDDKVIHHSIEEENLPESDDTTTATATTLTAIGFTEPFKVTYDVSFRPINRHFHHMHVNRPFWYRFPHRHNCHHHHHVNGNGNDKSSVREISYGNDMIMSQKSGDVHPMFRGDMRHIIPAGLGQFRAGGDRFPVKSFRVNGETLTKKMFKKLRHVEEEYEKEEEEKKETGFMKRFRKFLFDRI